MKDVYVCYVAEGGTRRALALARGSEKGREHGLGRSGGSAIRRLKGNGDWQFIASEGMILVANETILSLVFDSLEEGLLAAAWGWLLGVLKIVVSKA